MNRKRIPIEEFVEQGYLQEVNRLFLHPLGLALEVTHRGDDGRMVISGVWDQRDDPEGIYFANDGDPAERLRKAQNVHAERIRREPPRREALGYFVQPVGKR